MNDLPEKCSQTSECRTCTHLVDERYCMKWRDIVPDEVQKDGCNEWTQDPPF